MRTVLLCLLAWQLAVAGNAAAGYRDLGDGAVLDTATGLAWQLAAPTQTFAWGEALAYCEALATGGHTDWRLPNMRELVSLLDYSRYKPTVDARFAVSANDSRHWSSSTFLASPPLAGVINIYYGTQNGANKASEALLVRCVRDGPTTPPAPTGSTLLLLEQ
jgi:hypothetical protein